MSDFAIPLREKDRAMAAVAEKRADRIYAAALPTVGPDRAGQMADDAARAYIRRALAQALRTDDTVRAQFAAELLAAYR